MDKPTSKNKQSNSSNLIKYSGLAFQLLGAIVLGVFLGKFLDKKFHTDNIFTALCSVLFLGATLFLLIKDLSKPSDK